MPEETRTHLGQGLGGNHIHPGKQEQHRQEQEQELEQGRMMGLVQVLAQNRMGQGQMSQQGLRKRVREWLELEDCCTLRQTQ